MALKVVGQVVGGLGQARADDELEPVVLQCVEVGRREHPGIGHHDHVGDPVALLELGEHRDQGLGLSLVALEQVHLQRETAWVDEQAHLDLGIDAMLLAHPDLAQLVLVLVLEVQRGDVVHDERGLAAGAGRVRQARLGQRAAVVTLLTALQAAVDRVQRRRAHPDLVQHAHGVGLAGRLDDARQHERTEHLVLQSVEPELAIRPGEHLP